MTSSPATAGPVAALLEDLNPEQRAAVEAPDGPILVIAGAGSGKTRTLVYRVARLIRSGVAPENILLLTFTRKAAATMLSRAAELVGEECHRVAGGTFHGFAHRMLRRYGRLIGYPSFTILDRGDVEDLLQLLARQLDLGGPEGRFPRKGVLAAMLSKAANQSGGLSAVVARHYAHLAGELPNLERVRAEYEAYKRTHSLMDYDDLLLRWRDCLVQHDSVREAMGHAYRYIMVDEYQDTNATQAEIVRLMASGHDNVMVVGDDSQSIYSFRGANFRNILDFPRIFPQARIIKLERNYRATQPNLDCTNAIIANAREKFTKHLVAQRSGGRQPFLHIAKDEADQARFCAGRMEAFLLQGIEASEMAVLFRAGFHSFHLEAELNARGMRFVKRGGLRLFEVAHIKDVLCVLRLVINPLDRLSWSRILLLIPRLGPRTVEKVFSEIVTSEDPLGMLSRYETRAAWRDDVRRLGTLLCSLREEPLGLSEVLLRIEDWYRPHLERVHPEDYPKRVQELSQVRGLASGYEDAVSLLADLALDPPERAELEEGSKGRIVLSTIHSAKGLEWKVVFVLSLAEGRFPSPAAAWRDEDIEEERRLFYVAATRAKDELFFCCPAFVTAASSGIVPARPSRFLEEIPRDLLRVWRDSPGNESGRARGISPRRGGAVPSAAQAGDVCTSVPAGSGPSRPGAKASFAPGDRVRHPIFGPGRVIEVLGPEKVRVMFDVAGERTLHLGFAKLSLVA